MASLVLGGCQLFAPSNVTQCASDGDCAARGGDFANLSCIDSLCIRHGDACFGSVAPVVEDRNAPLHLRLRFVNLGQTGVKNVPVLVCSAFDEQCANPAHPAVLTDDMGYAYLDIWKNFRGTIQVLTPPTITGDEYLKIKLHFFSPVVTDDPPTKVLDPASASIRLLPKSIVTGYLAGRVPYDASTGQVIASVVDCDNRPRPDVHITAQSARSGAPIPYYLTDTLPSGDATATLAGGLFGVANAPEGPISIEATVAGTNKRLGKIDFFVNKGTLSNFAFAPTP